MYIVYFSLGEVEEGKRAPFLRSCPGPPKSQVRACVILPLLHVKTSKSPSPWAVGGVGDRSLIRSFQTHARQGSVSDATSATVAMCICISQPPCNTMQITKANKRFQQSREVRAPPRIGGEGEEGRATTGLEGGERNEGAAMDCEH